MPRPRRRPRELSDDQLLAQAARDAAAAHQPSRRGPVRLPARSATTVVPLGPCPVCHQPIDAGDAISTTITELGHRLQLHHRCATTTALERLHWTT